MITLNNGRMNKTPPKYQFLFPIFTLFVSLMNAEMLILGKVGGPAWNMGHFYTAALFVFGLTSKRPFYCFLAFLIPTVDLLLFLHSP
jgi:hypothetical protein